MLLPDSCGQRSRRPRQHHRHSGARRLARFALLAIGVAAVARSQSGLLEMRIVSGDAQVSRAESHLSRPLVIEVTDETGTTVDGAIVSFRLPEDGASGIFRNGLRTEILTTNPDGRAALRTLETGGIAGQFQIRITVAKGQARAGAISTQFIAPDSARRSRLSFVAHPSPRVFEIGVAALAVFGVGYAKAVTSSSGKSPGPPQVTIGAPTITLGKP